jgi:uncharacterized protein YndB with AHSA1/START domain
MHARRSDIGADVRDRELILTRIFDAPAELVYRMWTEPEHIRAWLCPRGFTLPFSEGEQRVGGHWRSCMRTPDGHDLWLSGVYQELVPGKKITFTHAWEEGGKRGYETVVTISLEDIQGKTRLTLHQVVFESVESRDGHGGGWAECLDKLAEHLAKAA